MHVYLIDLFFCKEKMLRLRGIKFPKELLLIDPILVTISKTRLPSTEQVAEMYKNQW